MDGYIEKDLPSKKTKNSYLCKKWPRKGPSTIKQQPKNGGNQNNLGSSDQRRLSHNIFLTFLNLIVYDFFKKYNILSEKIPPIRKKICHL